MKNILLSPVNYHKRNGENRFYSNSDSNITLIKQRNDKEAQCRGSDCKVWDLNFTYILSFSLGFI